MSDFNDRRKEPRKKLMAFTPVYDRQKGVLLGYIQDLTLQGVLVIGGKKLELNTHTTLTFDLPGDMAGVEGTQLEISARVARCEADQGSQTYKIGFEFTETGPEQAKVLHALLKRYHFRYIS